MDTSALQAYCTQHGLSIDCELVSDFGESLYEANRVTNLTRVPESDFIVRHVIDSLLVQEFIQVGSTVLDIGSGPGLPAWPVALARTDLEVTALDSSGKMLGFLRQWPLPNLIILEGRAEADLPRSKYDVVTGRAVAPLAIQLELSAPAAKLGGAVVPFRSSREDIQVSEKSLGHLGLELESTYVRDVPSTDITRVFPVFRKVSKTDSGFPRPWGKMRTNPLT